MTLTDALERAAEPAERRTVRDLLERMQPELQRALPAHIGAERFGRLVLTELRRTPQLYECSPESLLAAMMLAAQLGLEPGPLGHVYLVPFRGQVEVIVGYRGYIDLAFRTGQLRECVARTVYSGERWSYWTSETGDHYRHDPLPPGERGDPMLWYARARLRTGGAIVQVVYPEDVEAARLRSASGAKGVGPWADHYDAMARKTAVRRLAPFLPQSPVLAEAIAADQTPAELETVLDEPAA